MYYIKGKGGEYSSLGIPYFMGCRKKKVRCKKKRP